jgi:hypothetical protein
MHLNRLPEHVGQVIECRFKFVNRDNFTDRLKSLGRSKPVDKMSAEFVVVEYSMQIRPPNIPLVRFLTDDRPVISFDPGSGRT